VDASVIRLLENNLFITVTKREWKYAQECVKIVEGLRGKK